MGISVPGNMPYMPGCMFPHPLTNNVNGETPSVTIGLLNTFGIWVKFFSIALLHALRCIESQVIILSPKPQ